MGMEWPIRKHKTKPVRTRHPKDIALGMRIKTVRLEQHPAVRQQWLAREIGCSVQQIQKYESGETRVSFSRLCEIARALDRTLLQLIGPITA
jgi:transcriptional regulator with XRE-family HTH domain